MSREEAANVGGMERQTLRDWAHRFNAEGPEGLTNRAAPGRQRRLTEAQMQALAEIVETGPDPKVDGVVRWRRIDLKRVIEERFGVVPSLWDESRASIRTHMNRNSGVEGRMVGIPSIHPTAPR